MRESAPRFERAGMLVKLQLQCHPSRSKAVRGPIQYRRAPDMRTDQGIGFGDRLAVDGQGMLLLSLTLISQLANWQYAY
jgi:hypothetical protein